MGLQRGVKMAEFLIKRIVSIDTLDKDFYVHVGQKGKKENGFDMSSFVWTYSRRK